MAWGRSGSLMSLICWGRFILLRDEMALVGAPENPACNDRFGSVAFISIRTSLSSSGLDDIKLNLL